MADIWHVTMTIMCQDHEILVVVKAFFSCHFMVQKQSDRCVGRRLTS